MAFQPVPLTDAASPCQVKPGHIAAQTQHLGLSLLTHVIANDLNITRGIRTQRCVLVETGVCTWHNQPSVTASSAMVIVAGATTKRQVLKVEISHMASVTLFMYSNCACTWKLQELSIKRQLRGSFWNKAYTLCYYSTWRVYVMGEVCSNQEQ